MEKEEIKMVDFEVCIPNEDGTAIAKKVPVQIPVRYIPGVTPAGEEILTPEAHDIIEHAKTHHKLLQHGWPY